MRIERWALILLAFLGIVCHAQTFTSLTSLSDKTGAEPLALGQQANGNLWVTTFTEGKSDCGTVFQATLVGKLSRFWNFSCTDGKEPQGLTLGTDGNYYGVTSVGGSGNNGTVFKRTPAGALTVLYDFAVDGSNGSRPVGLALGPDGNFYGATNSGGDNYNGTLFRITPSGTLTTFYRFDFTNGSEPFSSPILGTDGNFYGTTYGGGANGAGTFYRLTPQGQFTLIYSFGEPSPLTNPLIQGTNGNFYSTTGQGGANGYGTAFEISPSGNLTVLHNFTGTDGYFPNGLTQATDGNFYGVTGGIDNQATGSIFVMTPAGDVTTLKKFNGTDGAGPIMLIQHTNGTLYGVTFGGGDVYCSYDPSYGCGTIFSFDVGLGSFVEMVPNLGAVGAPIIILGTNLKGVKSVSFNGTAAQFTVKSSSEVVTKVPPGATTGTVTVTDRNGTLLSNVSFTVAN